MAMTVTRRRWLAAGGRASAAALASLLTGPVSGQATYPTKSVALVVGFPPGGSTDLLARQLQPRLAERLGQPVVVENRAGAGGQIASAYVARSAPDGHVLFEHGDPLVLGAVANKNLPYDVFRDFAPVSLLVRFPLVLCIDPAIPANNLREFIDYAKARPGKINYGTTGLGSLNFHVAEDLNQRTGMGALHIPYGGAGPVLQGIFSGSVQFTMQSYAALKPQIDAGKLRPIVVTGATRSSYLPNVQSIAEAGWPEVESHSWIGLFAPAATPAAVIARLQSEVAAVLDEPQMRARLANAGLDIVASSPQELGNFIRREYERWDRFARENNIKFE